MKKFSNMNDVLRVVEEIRQRQIMRRQLECMPPVNCDQCGGAPDAAPTATKLPQDMGTQERQAINRRIEQ